MTIDDNRSLVGPIHDLLICDGYRIKKDPPSLPHKTGGAMKGDRRVYVHLLQSGGVLTADEQNS